MHCVPRLGIFGFLGCSCPTSAPLPLSPHQQLLAAGFSSAPTRHWLVFLGGRGGAGGVSVMLLVGYHCCRLTQQPRTPRDQTIGVPRGTDTISALVLEGGSGFACCIGGENRHLQARV